MELTKAVDNLFLYIPQFKFDAERFLREAGGSSEIFEIKTMDDIKTAVNSYRMVKYLEIDTHGSSGTIHLESGFTMDAALIGDWAATNPNFLQKNARILFDGCSIGEGTRGDNFMDKLAAKLLKGKGGVIGATTVSNVSVPLLWWTGVYMTPLSFGRLKIKKYDSNGKLDGSMQVDRHGIGR